MKCPGRSDSAPRRHPSKALEAPQGAGAPTGGSAAQGSLRGPGLLQEAARGVACEGSAVLPQGAAEARRAGDGSPELRPGTAGRGQRQRGSSSGGRAWAGAGGAGQPEPPAPELPGLRRRWRRQREPAQCVPSRSSGAATGTRRSCRAAAGAATMRRLGGSVLPLLALVCARGKRRGRGRRTLPGGRRAGAGRGRAVPPTGSTREGPRGSASPAGLPPAQRGPLTKPRPQGPLPPRAAARARGPFVCARSPSQSRSARAREGCGQVPCSLPCVSGQQPLAGRNVAAHPRRRAP